MSNQSPMRPTTSVFEENSNLTDRVAKAKAFWEKHSRAWDTQLKTALSTPGGWKDFLGWLFKTRDALADGLLQRFGVEIYFDEKEMRPACRETRPIDPAIWGIGAYHCCLWRCYNTAICVALDVLEKPSAVGDAHGEAVKAAVEVLKCLAAFVQQLMSAENPFVRENATISIAGFLRTRIRLSGRIGTPLREALAAGNDYPPQEILHLLPGAAFCAWGETAPEATLAEILEAMPAQVSKSIESDHALETQHALSEGQRVTRFPTIADGPGDGSDVEDRKADSPEDLLLLEEARGEDEQLLGEAKMSMQPRQREAIELHLQGLSGIEIAQKLKIKAATVHVHLAAAKAEIRRCNERHRKQLG